MKSWALIGIFCLCAGGSLAQAPKAENPAISGPEAKAAIEEAILKTEDIKRALFIYATDNKDLFPNAVSSNRPDQNEPNRNLDTSDRIFNILVRQGYFGTEAGILLTKSPGGPCTASYIPYSGMMDVGKKPFLCYPLVHGKRIFDPVPLGGKAVVRFGGDNEKCRVLPIESDGRVLVNGKDLFDPAQPYWEGKPPPMPIWPDKDKKQGAK